MPRSPRSQRLRQNLHAILGDGMAFSVMVGVGETYIPAFVLALGRRDVEVGLISSLPLLAGALLQLAAPRAMQRCGSPRRWVVLCVSLQAASFVPLAIGAVRGALPALAVFAITTVYWGSGMAAGPVWSTWVGRLVPERLRAPYWARRAYLAQACVLAGVLAGGVVLHRWGIGSHRVHAFALLFGVAALCRGMSARYIAHQTEVPELPPGRHVSVLEFVQRLGRGVDGRLLLFVLVAQSGVQIASPYFTPYMLRQLQLPYRSYVLMLAACYAAKIAGLPLWGRLARRHGARRVLSLAALGVVPLPALWLAGHSLPYLVCINFLSGAVWSAYDLGVFLLLFETIREEERTGLLTHFNLANALATLGGALVGGALLAALGATRSAYALIFALSFAARAIALLALPRQRTDVQFRKPAHAVRQHAVWRPLPAAPSTAASRLPSTAANAAATHVGRACVDEAHRELALPSATSTSAGEL